MEIAKRLPFEEMSVTLTTQSPQAFQRFEAARETTAASAQCDYRQYKDVEGCDTNFS